MSADNLNGCNLSVLECRDLLIWLNIDLPNPSLRRCKQLRDKLYAGAAKELPDETRAREEREHDEMTAEVKSLRKAIEDAPHAIKCRAFKPGYYGDCNCWKREALNEAD